jgi:DNA-binding transcriptional MerR regulator
MKIKELADLVGISVRTLHHYDEIGLLTPDAITQSGYRVYSNDNLETLQQILFFKELGFPLKEIKRMMSSPSFNREEALMLHRKELLERRRRLDQLINTIDKTMQHMRGEINMTNKEKFAGFDFSHHPYEQEARERWGDEAVNDVKAKINRKTQEEQKALSNGWDAIYKRLANLRNHSPKSEEAQEAIEEWYRFLNDHFGHYTHETFKGLGQMYVDDERFTKNINKYGEGLAEFMCEAMAVFAGTNNK